MSQPTTAPNTTALSAYEKNGVVIVETGLSLWITTVVGIVVLCVAIGFGIYVAFKYPAENEDDEDVKRVIVGNKALSIIAGTFIVGLIVWYIVAMARRSKTWDNERLESEAATLFAHAYGEKAKQLAVGTGGEKLTGFKEAMYGHLKRVFNNDKMEEAANALNTSDDSKDGGKIAAETGANKLGQVVAASGNMETEEREKIKKRNQDIVKSAQLNPDDDSGSPLQEFGGGEPGEGSPLIPQSPISLSRASRRRKSPSSLKKKKKKASPSSKKKKASPTKKKSTSSRRK